MPEVQVVGNEVEVRVVPDDVVALDTGVLRVRIILRSTAWVAALMPGRSSSLRVNPQLPNARARPTPHPRPLTALCVASRLAPNTTSFGLK